MFKMFKRCLGLIVALTFFSSFEIFAQGVFAQEDEVDPPIVCDGGEPADENGACPAVPLDGGVLFLLAAGAAYGAKKIRDNKQDSPDIS